MKNKTILLFLIISLSSASVYSQSMTFYRHATFILELNGKIILVDPMFAPKGSYPPIPFSNNKQKNPLIDLDVDYRELLNVDGVIITHNHNDHFDEVAQKELPLDIPILCQVEDHSNIKEMGFTNVTPISKRIEWLDIDIIKFSGTHGGGVLNPILGDSSSYLLLTNSASIYITGDTLLTNKAKLILKKHKPKNVIANAGKARMKLFGQITMSTGDILEMSNILPDSKIIAIHMDSLNHCAEKSYTLSNKLDGNFFTITVPMMNETISLIQ